MTGSLPVDQGLYYKYLVLGTLIPMLLAQLVLFFVGDGGVSVSSEVIALVISLVIGFGYVSRLKAAMSTVAIKQNAAGYVQQDSVRVGRPEDVFLFTKTERRQKPQNTSGSQATRT